MATGLEEREQAGVELLSERGDGRCGTGAGAGAVSQLARLGREVAALIELVATKDVRCRRVSGEVA